MPERSLPPQNSSGNTLPQFEEERSFEMPTWDGLMRILLQPGVSKVCF